MTDKPEIGVRLIRLADGTLIDPLTRQPVTTPPTDSSVDGSLDDGADANSSSQPNTIVPLSRRSMLDLTLNAQQMAVVNNVLVYTLWGLPDDEIALMCNCTLPDVLVVRELSEYRRMHDALVSGIRAAYTASAHGIISENAITAARVVVSNLRSTSKRAAFDAARDILDRSGHRPADHTSINLAIGKDADDALVIRVVRESDKPNVPGMHINGS